MSDIRWHDALELLILWAGIYLVLRSLKGTRGLGVLKGSAGIVILLYVVSRVLETQGFPLARLTFLIESLVTVALIAFVIVFQPELRRGLTRLGEKPFSWLSGPAASRSISPIVEAAGHMSRRRIGALIVLERNVGISGIIESGVPLSAEVTAPLLETIFYPNAPLHDGAVIVRGSRVVAGSCLLPLSDSPDLGPEVGTRHRAAVGLTEETDAIVVVVSEQTGRISVAHYGVLRPMRDTRELESVISAILAGGRLESGAAERTAGDLRSSRAAGGVADKTIIMERPREGEGVSSESRADTRRVPLKDPRERKEGKEGGEARPTREGREEKETRDPTETRRIDTRLQRTAPPEPGGAKQAG